MKTKLIFVFIISTAIFAGSCGQKTEKEKNDELADLVNNPNSADSAKIDPDQLPVMKFEKETHDFGSIMQGEKVQYSFKFKNEGKTNLIISSAAGSCGCTVPNYPKEPLAPGAEGKIDVTFDSAGKQGKQNKTVTLVTNAIPNTKVLTITGEVKVPEQKTN